MKNLDGRSLFGCTLRQGHIMQKESYKDYFDELRYDDDTLLLKFKEEFENDFWDDGKPIKYYMLLEVYDNEICCGVNLYMMPTMEFIHKDILQEIADDYDVPMLEVDEQDIINNKIVPVLQQQKLEFTIEGDWYGKEVVELLETATSVIPMIDRFIGFDLDKTINMIGTTNWDCLEGLLKGFDPIGRTIHNFKEETK